MDRDQPTEMIPMPTVSEFEVVLRGYDRAQVRETVERLDADVRIALTDRDAAVARASDLASQLSAMHAEMDSLRRKLATTAAPTYETMGERISHMLRLAEEEAAEIRRTAHTDAGALREQAQAIREQSETQRHKAAAETEQIRLKADSDAAQALTTARKQAASLRTDAERKATALITAAEAQRDQLLRQTDERNKRADGDFEVSLRARRGEAARAEAERLRVSTGEATKRVAEASADAESRLAAARTQCAEMIARAERERQRMEGIRHDALGQLREVRALLEGLPADTEPAAGNQPAGTQTAATQPAGTQPAAADPAGRRPATKPVGTEPGARTTASDSAPKPAGHASVPASAPAPRRGG